jgi:hypothetical protein
MLTLDTKSTMWYIQRNPLRQTKGLEKGWTEKEQTKEQKLYSIRYTVGGHWALWAVVQNIV